MVVKPLVAYYRVSTQKQGASGLGLEAQVAAVDAYARAHDADVLKTYQEIESGKRADRPELDRALAHAKRSGATLVIAKLDRLARNVHFLSGLMESGVDFIACDNPHANRLTIHILAAVAEDEARRISERTRAALAAYKARGGKLGAARPEVPKLTAEARSRGARAAGATARAKADADYNDLAPAMVAMRSSGLSLRAIATRLNAEGQTTRRKRPWNPVQVARVLKRAGG
jgi:DNA invertase Pin-like site-specific DNA recombinase